MGIYDRDYARAGGGGTSARSGVGGFFSGRSANWWLIAINVAVFVIGSLVFGPNKTIDIPTQRYAMNPGVSVDQRADAIVDRNLVTIPGLGQNGYRLHDSRTNELIGYQVVMQRPVLEGLGHFSTGKGFIELEVWRLVTFQFLHAGTGHLFMNMLGLYFFGPVVERRLGSKRIYLAFYLVCGIFGALLYLLLNLLGNLIPGGGIPGLLFQDVYTPLVGASAGVFGVLIATAFLAKDAIILLFFVLPMKIRHASILLIGIEMWHLLSAGSNAGGNAAHLGGAAAGWFFIRRTHLLTDFFEVFGPSKGKKKSARGTFPGKSQNPNPPRNPRKKISAKVGRSPSQKEVDRVLDKVREQGMHTLSEKEKAILQRATREQRGE